MKLFIAQKNYSSWSMRTWILFKAFDLPFQEVLMHYPNEKNKEGYLKRSIQQEKCQHFLMMIF